MKQAPWAWYINLTDLLECIDFQMLTFNHSIYAHKDKDDIIFVVIYVDDLIKGANTVEQIEEVKNMLEEKFKMTDLRY